MFALAPPQCPRNKNDILLDIANAHAHGAQGADALPVHADDDVVDGNTDEEFPDDLTLVDDDDELSEGVSSDDEDGSITEDFDGVYIRRTAAEQAEIVAKVQETYTSIEHLPSRPLHKYVGCV